MLKTLTAALLLSTATVSLADRGDRYRSDRSSDRGYSRNHDRSYDRGQRYERGTQRGHDRGNFSFSFGYASGGYRSPQTYVGVGYSTGGYYCPPPVRYYTGPTNTAQVIIERPIYVPAPVVIQRPVYVSPPVIVQPYYNSGYYYSNNGCRPTYSGNYYYYGR